MLFTLCLQNIFLSFTSNTIQTLSNAGLLFFDCCNVEQSATGSTSKLLSGEAITFEKTYYKGEI
jgi:hypothetical protein